MNIKVKQDQINLVLGILECCSYGPATIDSIVFWNPATKSVGRIHLDLVIEQLILAHCMTYTADDRLITTQSGEAYLKLQTQHIA